jgi:hypothetical protein
MIDRFDQIEVVSVADDVAIAELVAWVQRQRAGRRARPLQFMTAVTIVGS